MENEGIMALPGGMGMQGGGEKKKPITVSSADSYEAALTALQMKDPQEFEAFKKMLRGSLQGVEIPPQQLNLLIGILERLVEQPQDYPEFARLAQEEGMDVPDEFDPEFVGALLVVFNEMRGIAAATMDEITNIGPAVEGVQPAQFAKGGLADVASYLQAQGRGEDRVLAHITPGEAAFLESRGGAGTINPNTGLPEYGWLSKAWKSVTGAVKSVVKGVVGAVKSALKSPIGRIIGTIALAAVLGPAGVGLSMGTAAGLAGAGTTLLAGGSIKDALISGAMGYIGGGGTIMGANPVAAVGGYLPGAAGSALNTGLATGVIGTGIGKIAGMSTADALKMGAMSGASAAALQGLKNNVGSIDNQGNVATPDEAAVRNDVFRKAMAGDSAAEAMVRSGDYSAAMKSAGPIGDTGTARDLLSSRPPDMSLKAPGAGLQPKFDDFLNQPMGRDDFSRFAGGTGETTNYSLLPRTSPSSVASSAGGIGAATNYGLTSASSASAAPTGMIDKLVQGGKDLYNEYLSPSRPGLPSDAGILTKYGPLALAGTAVVAAAGGTKSDPANPNPAFNRDYTGEDYMRDNPNKFKGELDRYTPPSTPTNPIVPTPRYTAIPIGEPGVIRPYGITGSPGGVAQPYNAAGLYGVPLIYGPDGQPRKMARGGIPEPTNFPRRNGPINGPGTGTSDDIPAMLSDGEFVFTARAVRNAGGGSRRKGAARMYKLMKKLEGGAV
jgi:hypothetical protein